MRTGPDPTWVPVVRFAGICLLGLGMTIIFAMDYAQNGGNATVAMGASGTLTTVVVVAVVRLMRRPGRDPGDDLDE